MLLSLYTVLTSHLGKYIARSESQFNDGEFENPDTVLLDFSLTVKAATLIFISGCVWAISSAKEGKSGYIYNLVKN